MSSGGLLAGTVVDRLIDDGAPVVLDLDDTLFHKSGRHVDGAGIFRDAVRSTRNRTVHALGLKLVVVTVRVTPPWGGMPIGLPVCARVRRKHDGATTVDLARDMLLAITGWLPDRHFQLACDGAYATLVGTDLPRTHVTSRLRRDAATYELTPPRTGRRGRPRKKGDRLPPLAAMAAAATGWITVTYDQRGTEVTRRIWSRRLLWYHVAKDTPLLLVVVRDPAGRQPDDFFVTTDVDADPAWVAAHYAGRWTIEVTFRDTKQHLRGQDPSAGNAAALNAPPACHCGSTPPCGCRCPAFGFARFIASRPELEHVRTRRKSPHTNGVCERAFGSLKYEHLYRHEITDGDVLAIEAEHYRRIFNTVRPHEALDMRRPIDVYRAATPKFPDPETEPES